jgi:hypothetical protein
MRVFENSHPAANRRILNMGKNSRRWRWLYRNDDLSFRFANRLEAAGYPSLVQFYCEVIKPHRITGTKVFTLTTQAPYDVIKRVVGGTVEGLSRLGDGTYQVWYG